MKSVEREILGFVQLRQAMYMPPPTTEEICEVVHAADRHDVQRLWIDGWIDVKKPRKPKSLRRWVPSP